MPRPMRPQIADQRIRHIAQRDPQLAKLTYLNEKRNIFGIPHFVRTNPAQLKTH